MKTLILILLRLFFWPFLVIAGVIAGYWFARYLHRQMWEEKPGPAKDYELTPEEERRIYRGVMRDKAE